VITPGGAVLKLRQKYGKGLRVAYYRDFVRPRILATPPIEDTNDRACEIHVLTSMHDWLNLIWTLKSFYIYSGRRYALCIHEDGSLKQDALDALRAHFPNARLILRKEADEVAEEGLQGFPLCLEFRRSNLLAPKIFDFKIYLQGDRMALFDSDLLFFSEPTDFLERVENSQYTLNTLNKDVASAYAVAPETARKHAGIELSPAINSGFGLIHPQSIRFDWIEEFLSMPDLSRGHFWQIEQTLFALSSCRFGFEHLPDAYSVRMEKGLSGRPFRHYVGAVRHLMYAEGIRRLTHDNFLINQQKGPLSPRAS
jgi:hypothetical protein